MSEYGFQSFPNYQTFKQFGKKKDEDMYSKVMKHHQRSSIGNTTIEEYMKREYLPAKNFESLLYMSQIVQADGIKVAIEAHRRNKAKCMGSLYWQLNDCWPGSSWSSIDYFGRWKGLHYQVKKAFEPVILSHEFVDSNLHISAISDLKEVFNGEIEVRLLSFKSPLAIKSWIQQTNLNPFENSTELMIPYEKYNIDKKNYYLQLILRKNGEVISRKNLFLKSFKNLNNPNPNISYSSFIKENKITLVLNSINFAKGVFISSKSKSNFNENFFDLDAQEQKTIFIELKEGENPQEVRESIKILDVWSATHKPLRKI